MKKVSVIVPVYNKENTIQRCVNSILKQSYENVEIILVDDGSKDASFALCQKMALEQINIKAYRKENGGVSTARNFGLEKASGYYVQFLDADDEIEADMVEIMVKTIEMDDAQLVVCGIKENGIHGDICRYPKRLQHLTFQELDRAEPHFFKKRFLQSSCNKLFIKDRIKHRFPEELSYGEDASFCMYYIEGEPYISCVDKALYLYHNEAGESLGKRSEKYFFENRRFLYENMGEKYKKLLGENGHMYRELSTNFVERIILGLFDIYMDDSLGRKEKHKIIKERVECAQVQEALCVSDSSNRQKRLCIQLMKKKRYTFLTLLFWVKKHLKLYKKRG